MDSMINMCSGRCATLSLYDVTGASAQTDVRERVHDHMFFQADTKGYWQTNIRNLQCKHRKDCTSGERYGYRLCAWPCVCVLCMHACIRMHELHMHPYMHSIHAYIHAYIHTYTHAYVRTHLRMYTQTHTRCQPGSACASCVGFDYRVVVAYRGVPSHCLFKSFVKDPSAAGERVVRVFGF